MIGRMTMGRPQKRYDHRLRELVQRTGDLTIATDLGVPRSTARGWLRTAPTVMVSLEMANLTELELRQEILKLRRRAPRSSRHCSGLLWSCCACGVFLFGLALVSRAVVLSFAPRQVVHCRSWSFPLKSSVRTTGGGWRNCRPSRVSRPMALIAMRPCHVFRPWR
jgi:hypothetical protein